MWKLEMLQKAIFEVKKTRKKRTDVLYKGIERIFRPEQLERFWRAIVNQDHLFAFRFQFYLALRVHEIGLQRVDHCLFGQGKIKVVSDKTDDFTYLPLVEPTLSLIKYRIHSGRLKAGDLLCKLNEHYLRKVFREYCQKAGLNEVYNTSESGRKLHVFSTHVLRATAITDFYRHTRDPVMTMHFARHKDIESTMIYIRMVEEELAESMRGVLK